MLQVLGSRLDVFSCELKINSIPKEHSRVIVALISFSLSCNSLVVLLFSSYSHSPFNECGGKPCIIYHYEKTNPFTDIALILGGA